MSLDRPPTLPSFAGRFGGKAGGRLIWLAAVVMLAFGAAELPALARMGSHGAGVVAFGFASSTQAQPLPALAAACATMTSMLALSAAAFAVASMIAARRLPAATSQGEQA